MIDRRSIQFNPFLSFVVTLIYFCDGPIYQRLGRFLFLLMVLLKVLNVQVIIGCYVLLAIFTIPKLND